jgi:hypothetical protein
LGISLTLGRDILDSDHAGAPGVCVINEAFARRYFERRHPIGMRVTTIGEGAGGRTTCRIVGVAGNARTRDLRGEIDPRFFVPAAQSPDPSSNATFLIRTTSETSSVEIAARQAIQQEDSRLTVMSTKTLGERMAPLTAQDRTTAQLAIVFGVVALALAAIGLYGVLSYSVARRTGEIAIRIALGAQRHRVMSMILRETVVPVGAGLAAGAGLAYAASRLIDSRLYGVAPRDPLTFALAIALLLVVALGSAYLPARRASRLEPIAALRQT